MKFRTALRKTIEPYPELVHNLKVMKWKYSLIRHRVAGSPNPPPHNVKLFWLNYFQKQFALKTLIESGTFYGTTIAALAEGFQQIYSIELDPKLYEEAVVRFQQNDHIHIILGDSGKVLPLVLHELREAALFWLDGHYSGGVTSKGDKVTPILEEIRAIQSHNQQKNDVILIDDARLFQNDDQYPPLEEVIDLLRQFGPSFQVRIRDDMIQIYPEKKLSH